MTLQLTIYTPALPQNNLYCSRPQKATFWIKTPVSCMNTDEEDMAELSEDTEKEKLVQLGLEIEVSFF